MKKQELIKHIEDLPYKEGPIVDKIDISRKGLLELVKQLDEPGKVTIPQYVVDWIEYCKRHNFTLFGCLDPVDGFERLVDENFEGDARKCIRWCRSASDKLARAWLDGYEVEKEKRYRVKFIQTGQHLAKNIFPKSAYFVIKTSAISSTDSFTHKELEEAGFGWVFDCPGIKIEEVK